MDLFLISLLTVAASIVGVVTGFGASTLMVSVLVLFFPLTETLLLVGIIHWFEDLWRILLFRKHARWKLFIALGLPGILFSIIGAQVTLSVPSTLLLRSFGGILVAYVLFITLEPRFKLPRRQPFLFIGGLLTGLLSGMFGMGGPTRVLVLNSFKLKKAALVATSGAIAMLVDSGRLATYSFGGARLPDGISIAAVVLFVFISFFAAEVGKKLLQHVPEKRFRPLIALALLIAGIKLILAP